MPLEMDNQDWIKGGVNQQLNGYRRRQSLSLVYEKWMKIDCRNYRGSGLVRTGGRVLCGGAVMAPVRINESLAAEIPGGTGRE